MEEASTLHIDIKPVKVEAKAKVWWSFEISIRIEKHISFCKDASPVCRDGNRTAVLIGYTKGGEKFETEVLARVTMPIDFGL